MQERMKIATWNVNSIRTRLEHIITWLKANPVAVLCLQETKVTDQEFPRAVLEALGYRVYVSGQKSYNGVAILSHEPIETIQVGFASVLGETTVGDLDEQKRVMSGMIAGICVVNLYVPNGSEVGSEKYQYKLRWLTMLKDYLTVLLQQQSKIVVCGDFNIAPDDRDIHNPVGRENHIMASAIERKALQQAVLDQGFVDIFRQFNPESGEFTWWDYRAAAFSRNMGWRIDHHYLSPDLSQQAVSCTIDKEPRGWNEPCKPSDHVPVVVELRQS